MPSITSNGTSGTYGFNPTLGDFTVQAFHMVGIRPTALTQEHMQSSVMAANLMLSTWSARGVNLWEVVLTTIPLVQGTAAYSVPANIVAVLDGYVTVANGTVNSDRYIMPISRTEYASYANKMTQGFPTTYWFDKLLASPVITLWPVPDGNEVSFSYYGVRQLQDAYFDNGQGTDMPYYFYEAFVAGLAARLAVMWNSSVAAPLKAFAEECYSAAASQNIETSAVYISPSLSSYWRN